MTFHFLLESSTRRSAMDFASSSLVASMSTNAKTPLSSPSTASTSVMICRAKTALPAPTIVTFAISKTLAQEWTGPGVASVEHPP